jgi:hypothetical protein
MQFVDFGTGAMEPLTPEVTPPELARYTPALLPAFEGARQQMEDIELNDWSDWVVVPVSTGASFALPLLAVLLWIADVAVGQPKEQHIILPASPEERACERPEPMTPMGRVCVVRSPQTT